MTKHCPCCGEPVNIDEIVADRIAPCNTGVGLMEYQPMCKRCNSLKRDLLPTAELYKIMYAFRYIERAYPELKCTSIEVKDGVKLQRVYTAHLSNGARFMFETYSPVVTWSANEPEVIKQVIDLLPAIKSTLSFISCGPYEDLVVKKV